MGDQNIHWQRLPDCVSESLAVNYDKYVKPSSYRKELESQILKLKIQLERDVVKGKKKRGIEKRLNKTIKLYDDLVERQEKLLEEGVSFKKSDGKKHEISCTSKKVEFDKDYVKTDEDRKHNII